MTKSHTAAKVPTSKKALTLDKIIGAASEQNGNNAQKGVFAYPLSCKNCQHCTTPQIQRNSR